MILTKFEDIIKPIEEIWKNLNYKNIPMKNKLNMIINDKKLIHNFDDDIDNFILYALKYYDNLNCFVIFGKDKKESYKYYIDNYSKDYTIYGIKHISLKSSLIHKIMYQLLFPRMIIKTKNDLYNYLEENYKFLYNYLNKEINITVLILCKRDLKKMYPLNDLIDDNFCIYIPNTKEEIWNCSCVFFSECTLSFLEKQNFDYFLIKDMEQSKKMFLKYRNWLNTNVNIVDQSQFLLFSSTILYLLGHRSINDLDLYIHTISPELEEKVHEFETNENFNYIDYSIKNTKKWPRYWDTWLDEWAKLCGAKYFEEILGNPKYHFYFLGVKIISLDCDVVRRIHRCRPRAVADLIALKKRYSYHVVIPPINEKYKKYISIIDKSTIEINELIQKGGILNEKNQEICIEYNTDIPKFMNTIIYALHTRYRMTFTIDEIKRELNMNYDEKKERILNDTNINANNNNLKKNIKIIIKKK
jgi:hypothetical protein